MKNRLERFSKNYSMKSNYPISHSQKKRPIFRVSSSIRKILTAILRNKIHLIGIENISIFFIIFLNPALAYSVELGRDYPTSPIPSFDNYPVEVRPFNKSYIIPRNYFIITDFKNPYLKVTYPGFKPLDAGTVQCLSRAAIDNNADCIRIEFGLHSKSIDTSILISNALKGVNLSEKRRYLYYTVYREGPPSARIDNYLAFKNGSLIYFYCIPFHDSVKEMAICDDTFSLSDGTSVRFHFLSDQIRHVPEIQDGIKNLMQSFQSAESQK